MQLYSLRAPSHALHGRPYALTCEPSHALNALVACVARAAVSAARSLVCDLCAVRYWTTVMAGELRVRNSVR